MKLIAKFILFGMVALLLVGCANTRQFQDSSWVQKPAKIKVLFTAPVFPDSLVLTSSMKPVSDWFKAKVDNTLKFNSNVPYEVEEIPQNQVSLVAEMMDGVDVKIPKIESMSDSFDVYLIFDDIRFDLKNVYLYRTYDGAVASDASLVSTHFANKFANEYAFKKGERTYVYTNYAFYDVKTGKRLAYGHLEDEVYHDEVAAEQGWYDTARQMVLHALGKTPVVKF